MILIRELPNVIFQLTEIQKLKMKRKKKIIHIQFEEGYVIKKIRNERYIPHKHVSIFYRQVIFKFKRS